MSAFPHDGAPIEAAKGADRLFWEAIREGLLLVVKAIERRYLPHIRKKS